MREVAIAFLRLGLVAFGGPAAHIAMMEDEFVSRRQWISRQHFLDLVGATNLIPGPNSTEMTMHLGYERAGSRGLVVAGVCFLLPAVAITGVLAWAYVTWGTLPKVVPFFNGIKPVVVVLIVGAVWKLGRTAVQDWKFVILGVGVAGAILLGVGEVVTLLAGGAFGAVWLLWVGHDSSTAARFLPILFLSKGGASGVATTVAPGASTGVADASGAAGVSVGAMTGLAAAGVSGATATISLWKLFFFFLKIGAVLYGSGYVLIAFLEGGLVEDFGWLTTQQLLDAVAIGQLTPGPVLSTATFVGYVLEGVPGALIATLGIFLPSFFFVWILNPWIPRMRGSKVFSAFLDAVNVAAVGVMAAVTLDLGSEVLVDFEGWIIAVLAASAHFQYRISAPWLIIVGAVLGWALAIMIPT